MAALLDAFNSYSPIRIVIFYDLISFHVDYRSWTIGVRHPAGAGTFHLRHHIQIGSGAHPASYQIGTGGFFREDKTAGT